MAFAIIATHPPPPLVNKCLESAHRQHTQTHTHAEGVFVLGFFSLTSWHFLLAIPGDGPLVVLCPDAMGTLIYKYTHAHIRTRTLAHAHPQIRFAHANLRKWLSCYTTMRLPLRVARGKLCRPRGRTPTVPPECVGACMAALRDVVVCYAVPFHPRTLPRANVFPYTTYANYATPGSVGISGAVTFRIR